MQRDQSFGLSISHGLVTFILPFYLQDILYLSPSLMGAMFLVPAVFTITLAYFSGHISDKIGPRVPASIGVVATIAAYLIGTSFRKDSHWILPLLMLAFTGIGSGFFSSPNQAALLGSVPREHKGFATGMLHTLFGLGNLVGISLGGVLLALAFQYSSGAPGATLNPQNASAFAFSLVNFFVAALLGLVALVASLTRGTTKAAESSTRKITLVNP